MSFISGVTAFEIWQVDVFTSVAFEGNPLAVVFSAEHLSAKDRQAIARETNLSETVFISQPTQGGDYALHIHTTRREISFAVHPSIGAAYAFAVATGYTGNTLRQECKIGIVPIRRNEDMDGWYTEVPSAHFLQCDVTMAESARWLGLPMAAIATQTIEVASAGVPWLMVELTEIAALAEINPNYSEIAAATSRNGAVGVTVYSRSPTSGVIARLRSFAPAEGIYEDPVCGSCVGALAALLRRDDTTIAAQNVLCFEQGQEINRPGLVHALTCANSCAVGGNAVIVMRGRILIGD